MKAKANPTVTAPTMVSDLTYSGQAQELVTAGSATGGEMHYAVTNTNTAPTDESLYTTSIPSKTDAGTCYIWYRVKGDKNHKDTEPVSPGSVSIAGKEVVVKADNKEKTEGEHPYNRPEGKGQHQGTV